MANNIVNDGSVQYGSRLLTIGAEEYETDNLSFDTPTGTTIERTDRRSVPNGVVHIRGRTTGSATLQLADSSTPLPDLGAQFTLTAEGYVCTITSVGRAETKGGETKVNITFGVNITTDITITTA